MSILADDSETVREKAVKAILKIRHGAHLGDMSVQKFLVSTLNYRASHYSDIIADLCHEPISHLKLHLKKLYYSAEENLK